MSYRVTGLDPIQFQHLIGLSDKDLAKHGAQRYVVNAKPGYPDRINVRDMEIGETAILLNYEHQSADTPYRATHAIFVGEISTQASISIGALPDVIRSRPISLRAFNEAGEMVDADLCNGEALEPLIERFFTDPEVDYLHAHYAKRGCYAARIDRIQEGNN